MSRIRTFFKNVIQFVKKRCWYIILLIISTIYVYRFRNDIFQITELNIQNIIFVLWLILLGLPLFSEIEVGSVKLKKEIERTRSEVKESVDELKIQILDLKITNSNSNTLVFNNPPSLPPKDVLDQLQKETNSQKNDQAETSPEFGISEDTIYLFQVRLSLEKQLTALCNLFQYGERRSMYAMTQVLMQHEVIDFKIVELIREVINITNRGVHGEIVDDDYLQFVKNTYSTIKNALDSAHSFYTDSRYYCVCPTCRYEGPSKYKNVCPKCGFVSDDD